MKKEPKRFWRGFSWKRWALTLAWIFPFMVIWNLLFREWSLHDWDALLSWNQAGKTLTSCSIISLILTIWYEPPAEEKDRET